MKVLNKKKRRKKLKQYLRKRNEIRTLEKFLKEIKDGYLEGF